MLKINYGLKVQSHRKNYISYEQAIWPTWIRVQSCVSHGGRVSTTTITLCYCQPVYIHEIMKQRNFEEGSISLPVELFDAPGH